MQKIDIALAVLVLGMVGHMAIMSATEGHGADPLVVNRPGKPITTPAPCDTPLHVVASWTLTSELQAITGNRPPASFTRTWHYPVGSAVVWVGPLAVGNTFNGEITGHVGVAASIEIGLRTDGVVVWRKK